MQQLMTVQHGVLGLDGAKSTNLCGSFDVELPGYFVHVAISKDSRLILSSTISLWLHPNICSVKTKRISHEKHLNHLFDSFPN